MLHKCSQTEGFYDFCMQNHIFYEGLGAPRPCFSKGGAQKPSSFTWFCASEGSKNQLFEPLGRPGPPWGPPGALLAPLGALPGTSWGPPGASWGPPGASWGPPGASWGPPGGLLGPPGGLLGPPGGLLGFLEQPRPGPREPQEPPTDENTVRNRLPKLLSSPLQARCTKHHRLGGRL